MNYVILGSKPGQYRSEPGEGMEPVERWDYLFYGRKRASFLIARLPAEGRVRVIDEAEVETVNLVPTKFLEKFDSLDAARASLQALAKFGAMDIRLERAS